MYLAPLKAGQGLASSNNRLIKTPVAYNYNKVYILKMIFLYNPSELSETHYLHRRSF